MTAKDILEALDNALTKIQLMWNRVFSEEYYIGDRTLDQRLSHREDEKLFSDTVDYLKKKPAVKHKQIKLSCGEEIYLSIQ